MNSFQEGSREKSLRDMGGRPEFYSFSVATDMLGKFINKASESDSMHGNEILDVHRLGNDRWRVIIKRWFSYPYIIDKLKDLGVLE